MEVKFLPCFLSLFSASSVYCSASRNLHFSNFVLNIPSSSARLATTSNLLKLRSKTDMSTTDMDGETNVFIVGSSNFPAKKTIYMLHKSVYTCRDTPEVSEAPGPFYRSTRLWNRQGLAASLNWRTKFEH